jgi:DNA-binding LytR/AlgR family response regulator
MKVLIVDEDRAARSVLSSLCERVRDVQVVGEATCGVAAISAVEERSPDLLLLEAKLPDMTGFDVLRATSGSKGPLGIVVASGSEHGVTAFAAGAIDYLLKPVNSQRFSKAIERARQRCHQVAAPERAAPALLAPVSAPAAGAPTFLVGERGRRLYPLPAEAIEYIESDENYVRIRVGDSEFISRDTVKRLTGILRGQGFFKVRSSMLLNVRSVVCVERAGRGTFEFSLACGVSVRSSAGCRQAILDAIPLVSAQTKARSRPLPADVSN